MQPCKFCNEWACNCAANSPTAISQYRDADHFDLWRDRVYELELEDAWYDRKEQYYRKKDGGIVTPEMQREETERKRKLAALEDSKRQRLNAAVTKECAECFKEKPHDPDDFKCIVCRDGAGALPKKTYPLAA